MDSAIIANYFYFLRTAVALPLTRADGLPGTWAPSHMSDMLVQQLPCEAQRETLLRSVDVVRSRLPSRISSGAPLVSPLQSLPTATQCGGGGAEESQTSESCLSFFFFFPPQTGL